LASNEFIKLQNVSKVIFAIEIYNIFINELLNPFGSMLFIELFDRYKCFNEAKP